MGCRVAIAEEVVEILSFPDLEVERCRLGRARGGQSDQEGEAQNR